MRICIECEGVLQCVCVCVFVCVCACVCTYIIKIHAHTNIHTCTYKIHVCKHKYEF